MTASLDGLLIVDKPARWTSHDVVARVRRLLGVRRVGHAGTLDPLATGVLILGVGRGTRVLEYLLAGDKAYEATIRLGIETDTYDADGRVLATAPLDSLTEAAVRDALLAFQGTIRQRAPAYSAIKQGGRALHRLARAGETVTPPERTVTIFEIAAVGVALPEVQFSLRCSSGTYVRSLAHDLGARLGCGAHLSALRRTAGAGFSVEHAVTLEALEAAAARGEASHLLLPPAAALTGIPSVELDDAAAARLRHGVAPAIAETGAQTGRLVARDRSGVPIAVLERDRDGHGWRAAKVLDSR